MYIKCGHVIASYCEARLIFLGNADIGYFGLIYFRSSINRGALIYLIADRYCIFNQIPNPNPMRSLEYW